uniref:hypothetical protein n=1 Tax=Dialister hominis TaxID=2582419 RepID=UPI004028113D
TRVRYGFLSVQLNYTIRRFYMIFVLGSYVPIPFSYNGIQVSFKSIQWQIYSRCTCQTGRKSYMN